MVSFTRITPERASQLTINRAVVNAIRHDATISLARAMLALRDDITTMPVVRMRKLDEAIVFMPRWKDGRPPETREYNEYEIQALASGVDIWHVVIEDDLEK